MTLPASQRALLSIPTWSQNSDPLPDGQQDPFRATDCGEECAAMRIYYRTGIELPAGQLRAMIPNHSDHGETTAGELVLLMRRFGLRPVARPVPPNAIEDGIRGCLALAVPPIVLGRWLAADSLHWVLVVAADNHGIRVNDPWDGKRRRYPAELVAQRYAGWAIF